MATALLVGDMHIDNSKSSIANSETFNEIFKTFNLIKDTIYDRKPDYVIFFGDLFNSPYGITTNVITIISKLLADLAIETPIILLVGNHDDIDERVSKVKIGNDRYISVRASLLSPFSYYDNITVIDSPTVVKMDQGIEIAFVPYSNNILGDIENIDSRFTKGVKKLMVGHFSIKDVDFMQLNSSEVVNSPSAVELIEKYKYDMVLLGHIHDPCDYRVGDKVVKYIGSCRNVDFRNTGENKGIYILDFDSMELDYIDNPYTSIYKTFKDFNSFKAYCVDSSPEKLARTKVKYVYTASNEVKEISKLKSAFKSLQFQKTNAAIENDASNKNIAEFENLVKSDLVTKENLVEYAVSFKQPIDKNRALNTLDIILTKLERKFE